jgi:hypothetical protein
MNGVLLGYRLNYSLSTQNPNSRAKRDISGHHQTSYSVTVGPDKHSYVIKDLKKFTRYSIAIAGFNELGTGPYSQYVEILTAEDGKIVRLLQNISNAEACPIYPLQNDFIL